MILPGFLWGKGRHKSLMPAMKLLSFLESEAHVLAIINCNLTIFNEIGINRKLFELALILIALYFDPKITHTKVRKTIFIFWSDFNLIKTD